MSEPPAEQKLRLAYVVNNVLQVYNNSVLQVNKAKNESGLEKFSNFCLDIGLITQISSRGGHRLPQFKISLNLL